MSQRMDVLDLENSFDESHPKLKEPTVEVQIEEIEGRFVTKAEIIENFSAVLVLDGIIPCDTIVLKGKQCD